MQCMLQGFGMFSYEILKERKDTAGRRSTSPRRSWELGGGEPCQSVCRRLFLSLGPKPNSPAKPGGALPHAVVLFVAPVGPTAPRVCRHHCGAVDDVHQVSLDAVFDLGPVAVSKLLAGFGQYLYDSGGSHGTLTQAILAVTDGLGQLRPSRTGHCRTYWKDGSISLCCSWGPATK